MSFQRNVNLVTLPYTKAEATALDDGTVYCIPDCISDACMLYGFILHTYFSIYFLENPKPISNLKQAKIVFSCLKVFIALINIHIYLSVCVCVCSLFDKNGLSYCDEMCYPSTYFYIPLMFKQYIKI